MRRLLVLSYKLLVGPMDKLLVAPSLLPSASSQSYIAMVLYYTQPKYWHTLVDPQLRALLGRIRGCEGTTATLGDIGQPMLPCSVNRLA
jgi:hypothetical protein